MRSDFYADIITESSRISSLIADSVLYNRYLTAKKAVESDAALFERVAEYKQLNADYRTKCIDGFYHFDTEKIISNLYWELMLNDDASEYLRCESELAAVISGAIAEITKGCPLDL
jgi:cell fate (sporulation/competence/biofilm development) regulator YlbF (YheA/YmcA/DUF963 family)